MIERDREILRNLRDEDFVFNVEAAGSKWDVFRFTIREKRGTVAFKVEDRTTTIAVLQSGELTKPQVLAAVKAAYAKKGEERSNWVKGYVRNGVKIAGYFRGRKTTG